MTDTLETLIEHAVPASESSVDWNDVLRRAGVVRAPEITPLQTQTRRNRRGVGSRRTVFGLAATIVLLAVIGAVTVLDFGAGGVSAATVRARITHGLRSVSSMSGAFVVRTPTGDPAHPWGTINLSFMLGADGSFAERSRTSAVVYNASTGVEAIYEKTWSAAGVPHQSFEIRSGLDPASLIFSSGEAQLGAGVRQALEEQSPNVADTTFEGRSAWQLTLRFQPGDDFYDAYGAKLDVVVDQETGLILQVTRYQNGISPSMIETVNDLKIGVTTSAADFQLAKPAGVQATSRDFGFRRANVSQAAAAVGYDVLLPSDAGGKGLHDLAYAISSNPREGGSSDRLPIYHDVVSARYGNGLDAAVVSTRRGDQAEVPDLYRKISDSLAAPRTLRLSHGALAGTTAYLSAGPTQHAYVWAAYKGLIVQVMSPEGATAALSLANALTPAH